MMRGAHRCNCQFFVHTSPNLDRTRPAGQQCACSLSGHAPSTYHSCAAADLYQNHERFEKTYFEPFKVSLAIHIGVLTGTPVDCVWADPGSYNVALCRATTLRATAHALMPMGTSGSLVAWTMSSMCQVRSVVGSTASSVLQSSALTRSQWTARLGQRSQRREASTRPRIFPAAGHRIGTAEVENTLTDHSACSEAAVIG